MTSSAAAADRPSADPHAAILRIVAALTPLDALESEHCREVLRWARSTRDVVRRRRHPVAPRQHLVSYFLPVDSARRLVLLGDHRASGLWLPPGGHVEAGEHPAETVRRECREELAIAARFHPVLGAEPLLVTVTESRGDDPHRDVSLWYLLEVDRTTALTPDAGEYRTVRWWSPDAVRVEPSTGFDPHMGRMLRKVEATAWAG